MKLQNGETYTGLEYDENNAYLTDSCKGRLQRHIQILGKLQTFLFIKNSFLIRHIVKTKLLAVVNAILLVMHNLRAVWNSHPSHPTYLYIYFPHRDIQSHKQTDIHTQTFFKYRCKIILHV